MSYIRQAYPNELYHHGIRGQKWGVRRYQNPDGTLTAAGKKRYNVGEARERAKKAAPQGPITRHYTNEVFDGVKVKWHSKDDYEGLTKKEQKALKNSEKGRNLALYKETRKELKNILQSEEYKSMTKDMSVLDKRELIDQATNEAILKSIKKVSNMSIDDALDQYHKNNRRTAAILASMVGVEAAAIYLAKKSSDKAEKKFQSEIENAAKRYNIPDLNDTFYKF